MHEERAQPELKEGECTHSSGVAFGVLVIGVGLVWMLHRMGIVTLPGISVLWPSILIAIGFLKFFHRPFMRSKAMFGLLLMGAGGVLQLSTLGLLAIDIHTVWPMLVIVTGVLIIWSSARHKRRRRVPVSENSVNKHIIFGGDETTINTQAFEGGTLTCIFAGAVLDLRDADIAGESAVLHISAIFGGAELSVPPHFDVTIQGTPILGGFENKSRVPDHIDKHRRKRLILNVSAVFGGIEVKN